jgi:hypothetical protein
LQCSNCCSVAANPRACPVGVLAFCCKCSFSNPPSLARDSRFCANNPGKPLSSSIRFWSIQSNLQSCPPLNGLSLLLHLPNHQLRIHLPIHRPLSLIKAVVPVSISCAAKKAPKARIVPACCLKSQRVINTRLSNRFHAFLHNCRHLHRFQPWMASLLEPLVTIDMSLPLTLDTRLYPPFIRAQALPHMESQCHQCQPHLLVRIPITVISLTHTREPRA